MWSFKWSASKHGDVKWRCPVYLPSAFIMFKGDYMLPNMLAHMVFPDLYDKEKFAFEHFVVNNQNLFTVFETIINQRCFVSQELKKILSHEGTRLAVIMGCK